MQVTPLLFSDLITNHPIITQTVLPGYIGKESQRWWRIVASLRGENPDLCIARQQTLTSREIQTSVRLVFRGDLAKHAVSEGIKAVTKYVSV